LSFQDLRGSEVRRRRDEEDDEDIFWGFFGMRIIRWKREMRG
jgi:hypothetical protein